MPDSALNDVALAVEARLESSAVPRIDARLVRAAVRDSTHVVGPGPPTDGAKAVALVAYQHARALTWTP